MNETIVAPSLPPFILSLLPLMIVTLPLLVLISFIAKRKGVNIVLAIILGLIPMVNMLFALWLASKTDLDILRRLKGIEDTKS